MLRCCQHGEWNFWTVIHHNGAFTGELQKVVINSHGIWTHLSFVYSHNEPFLLFNFINKLIFGVCCRIPLFMRYVHLNSSSTVNSSTKLHENCSIPLPFHFLWYVFGFVIQPDTSLSCVIYYLIYVFIQTIPWTNKLFNESPLKILISVKELNKKSKQFQFLECSFDFYFVKILIKGILSYSRRTFIFEMLYYFIW